MILTFIENLATSDYLLKSAAELAIQLSKSFAVLSFVDSDSQINEREIEIKLQLATLNIKEFQIFVQKASLNKLSEIVESNEVSFLFIQLLIPKSKKIKQLLSACRDLRIPYIFYKDEFNEMLINQVIMPVSFLEEEVEKAQFAAAFGRFCNAKVRLLIAKDYGTKAQKNAEKIIDIFRKFKFDFKIENGKSDSFNIDKEAVKIANFENVGLIIVSASRDYGLDDTIFGPKELHLVKKSNIPILLINPRADLYTLCD